MIRPLEYSINKIFNKIHRNLLFWANYIALAELVVKILTIPPKTLRNKAHRNWQAILIHEEYSDAQEDVSIRKMLYELSAEIESNWETTWWGMEFSAVNGSLHHWCQLINTPQRCDILVEEIRKNRAQSIVWVLTVEVSSTFKPHTFMVLNYT